MITAHEIETVCFKPKNGDKHSPEWQVTLADDGTLSIFATGTRPGRMLVEPSSNVSIRITSEKIVARNFQPPG